MTARLVFVVLLSASAGFLADSAPTSFKSAEGDALTAAESPLVRTKRAEEILYGNHQNAPRVKKSDPSSATVDDDSAKSGDVIKDDALSTSVDENAVDENENREDSNEQHESQEEETGERGMEDVPPEVDDANGQASIRDYDEGERKKRSIQSAAMMTAENMMDSGSSSSSSLVRASSLTNRPVRAKRDLDYKDLRQLLEESRERPYYDTIPERAYRAEEDDGREEAEEEEEEEPERGDEMPLPYGYGAGYERPSAKDELLRELVERKVEEDAREKLLDYLLAAAIASEAESTEGRADAGGDGDVLEESPMRDDYEDVVDGDNDGGPNELAGVPLPMAKRNDFYPYSYEPYGGRWGALVPGSKRSSNEYERLYRLAQALNADEDYEEEE